MPILHWLFKSPSNTCSRNRREQCTNIEEDEGNKSRELEIFDKGNSEESTFTILLKREDSRACFYSTLRLKHLNSLKLEREQCFEIAKMGRKSEVGCKVLPICDGGGSAGASNGGKISGEGIEKDEVVHIKRRRAVLRMKELMRWAAAAKAAGKGGIKGWKVLYFKNKLALKGPADDASSNSRKMISFRWDVGSCSTSSSSVFSPLSIASAPSKLDHTWPRNHSNSNVTLHSSNANSNTLDCTLKEGFNRVGGQWITSDSDFVVLEL